MRQKYFGKKEKKPWYEQWWQDAQDEAADIPLTKQIEKLTCIPPIVTVTLAVIFLLYKTLTGAYNEFLLLCLSSLYPMLKSVRALQTEHDPEDDKIWLTYWCVYGFIVVLDKYEFDFFLEDITLYFWIKFGLYLWL